MSFNARLRRRLKLRDLDTVMAVARLGSMARAAAKLSMSQPAVSKSIAEIERTLGVRLFDRTALGVEPTPYGIVLVKWGAAVFDDIGQSVREIEHIADPTTGELRIGASEPMVTGLLPAILERLNQRYPRISFEITQGVTHLLPKELRARNVDILLMRVETQFQETDLEAEILFNEPVSIVAGRNNVWANRRSVRLAELMDEQWSLPPPESLGGILTAEIFRASGLVPPRGRVIGNSIQMHLALLATGRYLTVFPRSILHFAAERSALKAVPIKLPSMRHPIGIVRLKNRTQNPIARVFMDSARELIKQFTWDG